MLKNVAKNVDLLENISGLRFFFVFSYFFGFHTKFD